MIKKSIKDLNKKRFNTEKFSDVAKSKWIHLNVQIY